MAKRRAVSFYASAVDVLATEQHPGAVDREVEWLSLEISKISLYGARCDTALVSEFSRSVRALLEQPLYVPQPYRTLERLREMTMRGVLWRLFWHATPIVCSARLWCRTAPRTPWA